MYLAANESQCLHCMGQPGSALERRRVHLNLDWRVFCQGYWQGLLSGGGVPLPARRLQAETGSRVGYASDFFFIPSTGHLISS